MEQGNINETKLNIEEVNNRGKELKKLKNYIIYQLLKIRLWEIFETWIFLVSNWNIWRKRT